MEHKKNFHIDELKKFVYKKVEIDFITGKKIKGVLQSINFNNNSFVISDDKHKYLVTNNYVMKRKRNKGK